MLSNIGRLLNIKKTNSSVEVPSTKEEPIEEGKDYPLTSRVLMRKLVQETSNSASTPSTMTLKTNSMRGRAYWISRRIFKGPLKQISHGQSISNTFFVEHFLVKLLQVTITKEIHKLSCNMNLVVICRLISCKPLAHLNRFLKHV